MKLKGFKKGGVHPPEMKLTPADFIFDVELPRRVVIPLSQHIGAPASEVVKRGDHVEMGQLIGKASSKVSANVHTPISGTVKSVEAVMLATGQYVPAVIIEASEEDHESDRGRRTPHHVTQDAINEISSETILEKVAYAGIVGLGGATFPTPVKLSPPPGLEAEILIINGCECEPRLTCDDALMRVSAYEIIYGVRLVMKAIKVKNAIIGIEHNKPEAIIAMTEAASDYPEIVVQPLRTRYPQGGEKQLIEALTGKRVPSMKLPINVGVVVQNVATCFAIYEAVMLDKPLTDRVLTLEGIGNFRVPIGMTLADLPSALPKDGTVDVVIGGPMMGKSAVTLKAPMTKGTSGIIAVHPEPSDPDPCVHCGECVRACPMGLSPFLLGSMGRMGKFEEARQMGLADCMECGSCVYVCISRRPILDYIKVAKRART